jgi:hypothetical protein
MGTLALAVQNRAPNRQYQRLLGTFSRIFCGHSIEPGRTGSVWQSHFDNTETCLLSKLSRLRTTDVDDQQRHGDAFYDDRDYTLLIRKVRGYERIRIC